MGPETRLDPFLDQTPPDPQRTPTPSLDPRDGDGKTGGSLDGVDILLGRVLPMLSPVRSLCGPS